MIFNQDFEKIWRRWTYTSRIIIKDFNGYRNATPDEINVIDEEIIDEDAIDEDA